MTYSKKGELNIEEMKVCEIEEFLNNEEKTILNNLCFKVFKTIEQRQEEFVNKFLSDLKNGDINELLNNNDYSIPCLPPIYYAKIKFRYILENNTWDESAMKEFQDRYSSAHNFGLFLPLLRPYRNKLECVNGYFKEPITVNGKLYLMASLWRDHNITYLDIWLKKQNIKY